jgi:hypothetical protein
VSNNNVPIASLEVDVNDTKRKVEEILTEKHIEMARGLLSFSNFSLSSYSMAKPGESTMTKMIFLPYGSDEFHKFRRLEVLDHIKMLNDDQGQEYIKVREVTLNGKQYEFVYIDTRPLLKSLDLTEQFTIDENVDEDSVNDESLYEVYLKSLFNAKSQTTEEYIVEHNQKFMVILEKVRQKIADYLANPPELTDYRTRAFDKSARNLMKVISDPTEASKLTAVFKFIAETKSFADISYKLMIDEGGYIDQFDSIIKESGGYLTSSRLKQEKLSDLAREVDKIKNRLYIFDYLNEVKESLKDADLNDDVFEIYNRFKLDIRLSSLLEEAGKTKAEINSFIVEIFSNTYESTTELKDKVTLSLYKVGAITDTKPLPEEFFTEIRYAHKKRSIDGKNTIDAFTLSETIDNAIMNMNELVTATKELTLNIATATLYPQYLTAWTENSDAKERSFRKTYDQFKQALYLSEENPSAINVLMGSGEQQKDDVIFATARTLFDALRKQDYETFQNGQKAFAAINEIFSGSKDPIKDEKRKLLNEQFTTNILEIPEDSVIIKLKKTGTSSYEETKITYVNKIKKEETVVYQSIQEVKDVKGEVIEVRLPDDKNGDQVWLVKTYDFGGESWVKAKRTKALIHQFKYREDISHKLFRAGLDKEVAKIQKIWEKIEEESGDDIDNLKQFISKLDYSVYNKPYISRIIRSIKSLSNDYYVDMEDLLSSTAIKGLLYRGFDDYHKVFVDEFRQKALFDELESLAGIRKGELSNTSFVPQRVASTWLSRNTNESFNKLKEGKDFYPIESAVNADDRSSLMIVDKKILVRRASGEIEFLKYTTIDKEATFYDKDGEIVDLDDIVSFFRKSGKFQINNPDVYGRKQEELDHEERMKDKQYKEYYLFLKDKHDQANDEISVGRLEHYKIPQMTAKQSANIFKNITGKKVVEGAIETIENFKTKEQLVPYTNSEGEYTDELGNVLPEGVGPITYIKNRKNLDGYDTRVLQPKFTTRVTNQDSLETDLFISFMSFEDSVGKYKALFNLEPQMKLLKLITSGNKTKNNELSFFGGRQNLTGKRTTKISDIQTGSAKLTARAIEDMINHYVYDDAKVKEDFMGANSQKLVSLLKSVNAWQVLAFNWVAGFTNLEVGAFNNFSAGMGKKFGISTEAIRDGYREYGRRVLDAAISKYESKNLYERDHMTQLAIVFDAIKGNEVRPGEVFSKQSTILDKAHSVVFATSSLPEHANQLPLMIAYMKTYKVNEATGYTMWQAYEKGSKGQKTINFKDEAGNDLDLDILNDFMRKLDAINSEAHGNYGKYQTAMGERYAIGGLFFQFGRWIYPFLKSRFHKGQYNKQTQQYVERGHSLWYLKELVGDLWANASNNFNLDTDVPINVTGLFKDIFKGAKTAAINLTVKQATFMVNSLSSGRLAKNSPQVNKWLFGNLEDKEDLDRLIITEELKQFPDETDAEFQIRIQKTFDNRKNALARAAMETTWAVMAMFVGLLLSLSQDDDDEPATKWLKQTLEIQARRFSNDLGLITLNVNPFAPVDFITKKINDPMSVNGLIKNNIKLITQTFGFNISSEGINFKFDDTYEKGGAGYDQGDSKLLRALNKSIFTPVHQVIRVANPAEVEATLNLLNKNSIFAEEGN